MTSPIYFEQSEKIWLAKDFHLSANKSIKSKRFPKFKLFANSNE